MTGSRFCVALLFVSSVWAQGGFDGPGRYVITNVKSRKVIDLDRNDQTTVIQFSARGTENQTWDIYPAREGSFYIRNAMNGNALSVVGEGNGTPVQGLPYTGDRNQQWRIEPGKDGQAIIVSRVGKVLDIPDGTDRDGARIHIYERNGDSNQRFTFQRIRVEREESRGARIITCSSDDGGRRLCPADTSGGVRFVHQISGSPCVRGETWGYDRQGIWVDRGCQAQFEVSPSRPYFRKDR